MFLLKPCFIQGMQFIHASEIKDLRQSYRIPLKAGFTTSARRD